MVALLCRAADHRAQHLDGLFDPGVPGVAAAQADTVAVAPGGCRNPSAAHDVRFGNGDWFGEEPRVFRLGFGLLSMPDLAAGLAALSAVLRRATRNAA
ncbi:hypothetical protein [Pelagibius litoralis]|uniref:hypothetical protein n=1 Tax=Pelagibius litoralis TaxID=374515 RepID=UPI00197EEAE1|nr:hypothetical protein [Pelagibius litoralis]